MADLYTQLALVIVGVLLLGLTGWALISRRHAKQDLARLCGIANGRLVRALRRDGWIIRDPLPKDGPPGMRVHPADVGRHHITDSERTTT